VPACGAVLNTINTRLDTDTVAYIFDHGEAKIVLCDTQFLPLAEAAKEACTGDGPEIIEVGDAQSAFPATGRFPEYEDVLAGGDPNFAWAPCIAAGTSHLRRFTPPSPTRASPILAARRLC